MFGTVNVATRPAPGPVRPVVLEGVPHFRMPDDPAFCVCGDEWVQSMTCHPCRMPDHLAAWCVDGPGTVVAVGDNAYERTYPDQSAGRWCMCGHSPAGAGGTLRFADLSDLEVGRVLAAARAKMAAAEAAEVRTVELAGGGHVAIGPVGTPRPYLAAALDAAMPRRGARLVFDDGPLLEETAAAAERPVPEVKTAAEAAAVAELVKAMYGEGWSAAEVLERVRAERRAALLRGMSSTLRDTADVVRARARARHLMGGAAAELYDGDTGPAEGRRFCGDVPPS